MSAKRQILQIVPILVLTQLMAGVAFAGQIAVLEKIPKIACKLTSTGIESGASGQARLIDAFLEPRSNPWFPSLGTGVLSVSCRGLMPGETYSVEAGGGGGGSMGLFTASKKGELSAQDLVDFVYYGDGTGAAIPVFVINAAGEPVLQGTLVVK